MSTFNNDLFDLIYEECYLPVEDQTEKLFELLSLQNTLFAEPAHPESFTGPLQPCSSSSYSSLEFDEKTTSNFNDTNDVDLNSFFDFDLAPETTVQERQDKLDFSLGSVSSETSFDLPIATQSQQEQADCRAAEQELELLFNEELQLLYPSTETVQNGFPTVELRSISLEVIDFPFPEVALPQIPLKIPTVKRFEHSSVQKKSSPRKIVSHTGSDIKTEYLQRILKDTPTGVWQYASLGLPDVAIYRRFNGITSVEQLPAEMLKPEYEYQVSKKAMTTFYEPIILRKVKGIGIKSSDGLCPYCEPLRFLKMNDSSYLHHLNLCHGVYSNGEKIPKPREACRRQVTNKKHTLVLQEGLICPYKDCSEPFIRIRGCQDTPTENRFRVFWRHCKEQHNMGKKLLGNKDELVAEYYELHPEDLNVGPRPNWAG